MPRCPFARDTTASVDHAPDLPADLPVDLGTTSPARFAPLLAATPARGPTYGPLRVLATPVDHAPDLPADLPVDLGDVSCARYAPMLAATPARSAAYGPVRTGTKVQVMPSGRLAPIAGPDNVPFTPDGLLDAPLDSPLA